MEGRWGKTFSSLGIEFVSLSEQVDTSTPAGKLVFTVLGAVAELERCLIAERVRAGLRNARAIVQQRDFIVWLQPSNRSSKVSYAICGTFNKLDYHFARVWGFAQKQ